MKKEKSRLRRLYGRLMASEGKWYIPLVFGATAIAFFTAALVITMSG